MSGTQLIIGLVIGILLLVALILKTKIHTFIALILSAAVIGLISGLPPADIMKSITTGFGNTLGAIGIVIGLGVMMGRILEISGAAERMAYAFLRYLKGKEEWALAATGYIVSIPIFCDSGFVILSPIARALSEKTKKSAITMGIALAIGLVATHHAVPPTPGPLAVAGIFGADVGLMIIAGLLFALPIIVVGVLYAKWLGKRIYQVPTEGGWKRLKYDPSLIEKASIEERKDLPSTFMAFAPIVIPLVLISLNTITGMLSFKGLGWLKLIGDPVIAVAIGLIIAIYGLVPELSRNDVLKVLEEGVASAGIIILVTGGGGALGQVLRDTGVGAYIANAIVGSRIPVVLLPFIISTLLRFAQGSGTVAMITSASITAPIIAQLSVNPIIAAQAATLGAMFFSYFNDSYFWVVNRLLGIEDPKEQIMAWSVPTTLGWGASLITILVASLIW